MQAQDAQEDIAPQAIYVENNVKPPRLANSHRKFEMK